MFAEQKEDERMETQMKFLGVCIVVVAAIVAGALIYHAQRTRQTGRYQFHPSTPPGVIWKMDTVTGEIKAGNG